MFSLCCDEPAEDPSFDQHYFPWETPTWFVRQECWGKLGEKGSVTQPESWLCGVTVYQFPQGLGRKGRLLQSYIIIKVACGDDLIGLSFRLSSAKCPASLPYSVFLFIIIFFNRNMFWNVLNHRKFKEGQILISHLFMCAGWLTQGIYVEAMTRQNKCGSFPSLTLSILSATAHTHFSFKYLEISLTP